MTFDHKPSPAQSTDALIKYFMSNVVPWPANGDPGYGSIHWKQGKNGRFLGRSFQTIDPALACVADLKNSQADIWFCTSIHTGRRKRENALGLICLPMDLDIKSNNPKHYSNPTEAIVALLEFCVRFGIPRPSFIVISGGGLHVYWISDRVLTVKEWQPYANAIKAAALDFGLKFDPTCTGDAARVLRVPGTMNYKYDPPRPVRVLATKYCSRTAYDFAEVFKGILSETKTSRPRSAKTANKPKIEIADDFKHIKNDPVDIVLTEIPPPPFEPAIKAECGWLREAYETGGKEFDNPQWNLTTLIATWLEDGHALAHKFGDKHPDYTLEETDKEWERKNRERAANPKLGWPSCKAIRDAQPPGQPSVCDKCQHFKKGRSPLNLADANQEEPEKPRLPAELRNMLHLVGVQPVGDYKTRRHLLWAFIHTARRRGIDENEIVNACLDEKYRGCAIHDHVQNNGGKDFIKGQIERAINSDPLIDEQERSIIRIEDGKLDEHWRAVQHELITRGCPVYVRGNRLVQPLWRWEKADNGREVLTARFEPYNVHRLADMVAQHACKFQKYDGRKRGFKDIDPPDKLIERMIEAKNWKFSTIVGIVNAPTMRADGSLLITEGYDPATQLWFKSSGDVTLPPIPDNPSKEDAQRALAKLSKLLEEFPFDNAVARATALAGIMTPVLRGALQGAVPLFAVIATEPRSGKTYLVELIAVIATGHVPVPTSIGSENTEEMEKRIETAGLSGRPIMHLNNLPNGMMVTSVALAQLSTEGVIFIRKLGRHEEGLCDCRATTAYLNGNNIVIAEDLVPRTASCQLNARLERPENRTFAGDPIKRVRADRGSYLGAVFTIARAFMAAGSPHQPHRVVAGFEQWSRLVQQPLIWLGEQDSFGGMDELRALDPKHEELQTLIDTLKKHFPADAPFTVADCQQKAEATLAGGYGQRWEFINPDLRAVMADARGQVNSKAFGRKLVRHRNRIHRGWYIEVVTDWKEARVSTFKIKAA